MLELGCGCGLVGLTAAAAGSQVVLTDLVLAMAQRNLDANFDPEDLGIATASCSDTAAGARVMLQQLQWGSVSDITAVQAAAGSRHFDFILGTDLLYSQECWRELAQARFDSPTV